ncbi:MAG: hypothetical protein JKY03_04855 [Aureispira sp.]|nr:hypothetical protein [Aureispira sp.]
MQKISHVLFLLSVYLFISCTSNQPRKEAFIAGCFDSGIIFYQFEMYPDSSYCLDILGPKYGIWSVKNDTFLLFEKDNLKEPIAKIFELKCFYGKGGHGILRQMNLKAFNPPKVIVYPKSS